MQQVFPLGLSDSSTRTASRSFQPFLPGSLGDRPTDRPTDHASLSLAIGGAHSGEANCLLSTATTSIHWSSRLDRSDQLQQPAAIFSCKTRRVAVYLETLQYSLKQSVSHRRTQPETTDAQAV